jgi:hypothetical protein
LSSQFFGSAARTLTTYKELVQAAAQPDYLRAQRHCYLPLKRV